VRKRNGLIKEIVEREKEQIFSTGCRGRRGGGLGREKTIQKGLEEFIMGETRRATKNRTDGVLYQRI